MKSALRKTFGSALMALAGVAAPLCASAAIVTGSWDPALPDPPFANLGWTTTINLKISDDCKLGAQSLPYIVNLFGRSFGCGSSPLQSSTPFSILSAEIGLYDLTTRRIVDVLTFDPSAFVPLLLDLDSSSAITYLLSVTDSNPVQGHIDRTDGFFFRLDLPGEAPAIRYRAVGDSGPFVRAPGVPTETAFSVNDDADQAQVLESTRLQVGQPVFTALPEPGSLALALLALGGLATAGARRRSRGR
jgi:hypothetical protein